MPEETVRINGEMWVYLWRSEYVMPPIAVVSQQTTARHRSQFLPRSGMRKTQ